MAKNYQYKFPYNACFAGTIEHITSLYVWKQRVIEALERFRRELPHGDTKEDFIVSNENHLKLCIYYVDFLSDELNAQGYISSVNKTGYGFIEIAVNGKKNEYSRLNGPNTGRFRLYLEFKNNTTWKK